jgi:1-acyl-sn-glycerol-3-phosphate acyltransferase
MNILTTITSFIAKCLLFLLRFGTPETCKNIMKSHDRIVFIATHTSYMDSVIIILYVLAYPEMNQHVKYLVGPNFFDIPVLSFILRYTGAIPSSSIKVRNGGRTKEVIDYLNSLKKFHLVISPKGTIQKSSWRTGYYHIAEGTKAMVYSVGFDYEDRILKISDMFNDADGSLPSINKLEQKLQNFMRTIGAYNPDNTEY